VSSQVFRRGLALKAEVADALAADYHSRLVADIKANDNLFQSGRLRVYLAREFGFCYGVDRAVDYAYQASRRFPDRRIVLTGEIIHNPHVNRRLRDLGVQFLTDPGQSVERIGPDDVVILPAFGVTVDLLDRLESRQCTLVDTTCGSVLNVWKNVRQYAQDGFTSVIHGKYYHEETRATASQALRYPGGQYLVVLDRAETELVAGFIRHGGDERTFLDRFEGAVCPGFVPSRDLGRIGLANQTTMLASESIEVGEMLRAAIRDRYGDAELDRRFRAFDTICSATQDRQDAVMDLLDGPPLDLVVVIGGYNSSNTANLARICAGHLPTFHVADASCLVSPDEIHHRPVGGQAEAAARGWLPQTGEISVGLTAGASTPDVIVGEVVERLARFAAGPS